MRTQTFEECINEISLLGKDNTIAIMCAEALPWRCRRRFISNYLTMLGLEVYDIKNTKQPDLHIFTLFAQIVNGEIRYSASNL